MTTEEFVRDLREVADFFEAHPKLPVPAAHRIDIWVSYNREAFAAAVRELGKCSKHYYGNVIAVRREFGKIEVDVNAPRENVCERVVVGERTIPEHTEEIVEWRCTEPILEETR